MYVSRLTFLTLPGKTGEVEHELKTLRDIVKQAGGENTRILRTHFASPDAPNVVFTQDAPELSKCRFRSASAPATASMKRFSSRTK